MVISVYAIVQILSSYFVEEVLVFGNWACIIFKIKLYVKLCVVPSHMLKLRSS